MKPTVIISDINGRILTVQEASNMGILNIKYDDESNTVTLTVISVANTD